MQINMRLIIHSIHINSARKMLCLGKCEKSTWKFFNIIFACGHGILICGLALYFSLLLDLANTFLIAGRCCNVR